MSTKCYAIAAVILFTGFISCKDEEDEPTCSTAWGTELQAELNAVINAGQVYANDPSDANCLTYKARYEDYIDALRPYGNCSALTGQSRTDFNTALEAAEDDVATLCD